MVQIKETGTTVGPATNGHEDIFLKGAVIAPATNGHRQDFLPESEIADPNTNLFLKRKVEAQTLFEEGIQRSIANVARIFDLAAVARRGQKEQYLQERNSQNFITSRSPGAKYGSLAEPILFAVDQWSIRRDDINKNARELISLLFGVKEDKVEAQPIEKLQPANIAYAEFTRQKNGDPIKLKFRELLKTIGPAKKTDLSWLEKYFFQFTIKELLERAGTETQLKLEDKINETEDKDQERLQRTAARHKVEPYKIILTDEQFATLEELAKAAGYGRIANVGTVLEKVA